MPQLSEAAASDDSGEIDIGLSAVVVLDGNPFGSCNGRLC
jgi:hypothetical protein